LRDSAGNQRVDTSTLSWVMVKLRTSISTRKFSLVSGLLVALVLGPSLAAPGASADPLDDKRRQAANIADQLERLGDQMNSLGEDYAEALTLQSELGIEIEQAQADVAAAEAQLAQMRGTLYLSAVTQFMHGGRNSTLTNLLASSGGVQDALQRGQLMSVAMNQGALTTDSLDSTAIELTKKQTVLERKRKQAENVAANVLKRQSAAEALSARYEQLQSAVQGDLVDLLREERQRRESQLLADSQRQAAEFQSRYAATQKKYANIPSVSARAQTAVRAALTQLGVPYRYATSLPGKSFDCSGLTTYAWGKAGVGLPRNSRAQFNALPKVPKNLAQAGDLIFTGSPIHHVGIYLGNGTMVHAPQTGDVVKIGPIRWWKVVGVARPR
jgi:cell wall-associated NlpC family hydrolase